MPRRALESARKGGEPAAGKGLERPKATELLQGKPGQAPAARAVQKGLTLKTAATNPQGAQSPSNPFSQFQQVAYTLGVSGTIPTNFAGNFNQLPALAFSSKGTPVSVSKMNAQIVSAQEFLANLKGQVQKGESKHITPEFLAQAEVMVKDAAQAYVNALIEFNTVAKTAKTANPLDDSSVAERLHEVSVAIVFAGNQLSTVLKESSDLAKTNPAEALASINGYIVKTQSLGDVVRGTALVAALGGNLDATAAKKAVQVFEEACGL
ncbi:MAG: hypothetical protein IPK68_18175 [Bdellovibrionales bacterium]|nr:hypothetical protein [Bdellovibrionales bacterium]